MMILPWEAMLESGHIPACNILSKWTVLYPPPPPREDAGVQVENTSSVSPACRKRRLKGRRYIAIVADTA